MIIDGTKVERGQNFKGELKMNTYKKSKIIALIVFIPLLLIPIIGCTSHDDSNESHQQIFAEWFGASTAHPYILIWEESGLVGLGILEQEQVEAMMAFEEFNEFSDAVGSAIERLLTGGFPILNEFDADKFLIATSIIDFILDDLKIDVELLNAWNDLIQSD